MIFSDEYDRTLRLILLYDKKNRYEIAKLLNCLPLELFENIRIGINKCRNEENKDDIIYIGGFSMICSRLSEYYIIFI